VCRLSCDNKRLMNTGVVKVQQGALQTRRTVISTHSNKKKEQTRWKKYKNVLGVGDRSFKVPIWSMSQSRKPNAAGGEGLRLRRLTNNLYYRGTAVRCSWSSLRYCSRANQVQCSKGHWREDKDGKPVMELERWKRGYVKRASTLHRLLHSTRFKPWSRSVRVVYH